VFNGHLRRKVMASCPTVDAMRARAHYQGVLYADLMIKERTQADRI
jgi:phosphoribosylamine-glycine ligase